MSKANTPADIGILANIDTTSIFGRDTLFRMSEMGKMNIGMKSAQDAAVESHDMVLKRIGPDEFKKYERAIRESMRVNALDKGESKDLSAREEDVTGMYDKYFSSGKNGQMYVATEGENGKILAFVALRKEGEKEAAIDQVRLLSTDKKSGVLKNLLMHLSHDLKNEGILRCSIDLEEDAGSFLDSKEDNDWFKKFYHLRREEGAEETHLEKAA